MRPAASVLALLLQPLLQAQVPAPAKTVRELKAFYAANCAKCHGPDGSAVSAEGKRLGGFDFTDAERLAGAADRTLVMNIRNGIFFGLVMPGFKADLTEEEALLMAREVLRKAEKGKAIAPEPEAAR